MSSRAIRIEDVEGWNDAFARENAIDDYYARSGSLIRWVEGRRLSIIARFIDACPDDRIVEVGCGGGHVLSLFPQATLTGVDVSGVMLDTARRRLRGFDVALLKGELHELGLEDGIFTKAVCTEVLEHALNPERILHGIRRVVAPGGTVVITFPHDRLINRIKGLIRRTPVRWLPMFRRVSWGGDRYHLHVWSVREMRGLLSRFFTVESVAFAPSALLPLRCCFRCRR